MMEIIFESGNMIFLYEKIIYVLVIASWRKLLHASEPFKNETSLQN